MKNDDKFSVIDSKQIREIVSILEFCTDSFVFVYDIDGDVFCVSSGAIEKFSFPSARFSDALRQFIMLVREDERDSLIRNIERLSFGTQLSRISTYHITDRSGTIVPTRFREILIQTEETGGKVLVGCIDPADQPAFDEVTGLESEKKAAIIYKTVLAQKLLISGFFIEIDIDDFATFDEREGFEARDKILSIVAQACRRQCTDGTSAYQTTERKFILMNLQGGTADTMRLIYSNLKREIQNAEYLLAYKYTFTISAGGIALYKDTSDLPELIRKLSFSLDTAKQRGKNTFYLFNTREYNDYLDALEFETLLRTSARRNFEGFTLFYQPVIDARKILDGDCFTPGKHVIGAEALLRWESRDKGLVGAECIVPVLERSCLIIPVGRWVLMAACTQCAAWNKKFPDFHMSINISYVQIKKTNLVDEVQAALEKTHVTPGNIILELTESGLIESGEIQTIVSELAALGVQIDIDDFGTGYSNLRYIQDMHANTLKFDYSFIHQAVTGNGKEQKIIEYITKMAHDLGMAVCMEGIESRNDIKKLGHIMPDKFQGFLFGRPVAADRFEEENLNTERGAEF
jgi:EAL domain-containing protein (putative c-di-GMP-specific phosphodiesterase class I)/GGDEF domain-containing protein